MPVATLNCYVVNNTYSGGPKASFYRMMRIGHPQHCTRRIFYNSRQVELSLEGNHYVVTIKDPRVKVRWGEGK